MKNIKNSIKDIIEFLNGFRNMINDLSTQGKRIKQIPNLLTLSRIGFAFIIPPLALSGYLIPAAAFTIIAALTDAVDGYTARKLDAVSEFGKNLDPVCDKIFAGSLLLPLIGNVSPILSVGLCANLGLELGIAGVNLKSKAKGNVPRTTILGKLKTVMLSILIAALYVSFSYQVITSIIPIIYTLATTIQTITLMDYHRIDKIKDAQKKIAISNNPNTDIENPDNSNFSKSKSKGVVDHFIAKEQEKGKGIIDISQTQQHSTPRILYNSDIYSREDYKKLREEVIRTKTTIQPQIETLEDKTNTGFQKTNSKI